MYERELIHAVKAAADYLMYIGYAVPEDVLEALETKRAVEFDDDIDPDEVERAIQLHMADYRAGRITMAQLIRKVRRATGAQLAGEEKPQDADRLRDRILETGAVYGAYLVIEHLQGMGYEMPKEVVSRISETASPYKPEPLTKPTDGSQTEYGDTITRIITGFYNRTISYADAIDRFTREIEKQFTAAWQDGMNDAGINPDDMTQDEKATLDSEIRKEENWILGFLMDADQASADGKPIDALLSRVPLWANRYAQIRTLAKIEAAKNQPLEWKLGATEQHCTTCAKLNGIVKRAKDWKDAGILPQNAPNGSLECGGWQCDCRLDETKKPVTRGPFPKVP